MRRALERLLAMFATMRFARFLVFGGLAAVVNLVVGKLIYSTPGLMAHLPYWLAVAIGATSGLIVNFALNYAYNFRYFGRSAIAQFRTFVIVALGGVGLTALLAEAGVRLAGLTGIGSLVAAGPLSVSTEFASHVIAVGLVTFYSFACHSAFSFNDGLRSGFRKALTADR